MGGEQTLMRKLLSVGVLAGILAGAVAFMAAPYMRIWSQLEETQMTQELVTALQQRVASQTKSNKAKAAKTAVRPQDVFVDGATAGIAGAELQSRLAQLVERNGGKVKALLVLPTSQGAKANLVSVNIVANLPFKGLQQALYDIEASTPLLFIDNIVINVPEGERRGQALKGPLRVDVTMLVSGYRSASPPS